VPRGKTIEDAVTKRRRQSFRGNWGREKADIRRTGYKAGLLYSLRRKGRSGQEKRGLAKTPPGKKKGYGNWEEGLGENGTTSLRKGGKDLVPLGVGGRNFADPMTSLHFNKVLKPKKMGEGEARPTHGGD